MLPLSETYTALGPAHFALFIPATCYDALILRNPIGELIVTAQCSRVMEP